MHIKYQLIVTPGNWTTVLQSLCFLEQYFFLNLITYIMIEYIIDLYNIFINTSQCYSHHDNFCNFIQAAFEKGHCYEPYILNGNFTTTDKTYGVGALVQFSCETGHSLEQGPPVIECINTRDPYWNDTEPLCKGISMQKGQDGLKVINCILFFPRNSRFSCLFPKIFAHYAFR